MSENEIVVENTVQSEPEKEPSKGQKFKAGLKEWFRKKIVALKRKPNVIPLLFFVITSVAYLLTLGSFSQAALVKYPNGQLLGFPVFVNVLLSLLIVVLHMNAFPKRSKKISIPNYVLVYVFAAIMVAMDVVYYIKLNEVIAADTGATGVLDSVLITSLNMSIAHIVLLGISLIVLATLPLYKKLIMKINTSKTLEASQLNEQIDTEEDV